MHVAVMGGGPAGLRAAEVARGAGADVTVFEGKASVGRKFLVAGRGGLNLTHTEAADAFAARYSAGPWSELLAGFDAASVRAWAEGLGVDTFVASSGRVYPTGMKAAPLLRRWVQRLKAQGVVFRMHHRWAGWAGSRVGRMVFETPAGRVEADADAVVLALGGGSWPETGSDGGWVSILRARGVEVADLRPANCGWEVAWDDAMRRVEGRPLKNVAVTAGGVTVRGELLVTRYGLEGGALYQLGAALRGMADPEVRVDLKPDHSVAQLVAKLGPVRRNWLAEGRARWRLDAAASALAGWGVGSDAQLTGETLAAWVKSVPVRFTGPRPLAEAISTAGGVAWGELDGGLMVRRWPGLFVAGEMVDWEAPTGGYLMQGAFATGTRAGRAAAAWRPDPA